MRRSILAQATVGLTVSWKNLLPISCALLCTQPCSVTSPVSRVYFWGNIFQTPTECPNVLKRYPSVSPQGTKTLQMIHCSFLWCWPHLHLVKITHPSKTALWLHRKLSKRKDTNPINFASIASVPPKTGLSTK